MKLKKIYIIALLIILCSTLTEKRVEAKIISTKSSDLIAQNSAAKADKKKEQKLKEIKSLDEKKKKKKEKKKKTPEEIAKEREEKLEKADKKNAEWIEKTIKFGVSKGRKEAINSIPTVRSKERKEKIITLLNEVMETETDATVLRKAIIILSDLKSESSKPLFKKGLDHESEDVRIASVYALKELKAKDTEDKLVRILKKQKFSEESNFTEALIITLGDFESKKITDFALEKLKEDDTTLNLRIKFLILFGQNKDPKAAEFLAGLFSDQDEDLLIRSYAVNSLSKMDYKKIIPEINKFLSEIDGFPFKKKKKYYNFQIFCIAALARMGDKSAYPRLISSLKSDSAAIRLRALRLLRDLKDKRSIDILKYKAEYDTDRKVKNLARKSLKEDFGIDLNKEKITELVEKLKDEEPYKKLKTLRILYSIKELEESIEPSAVDVIKDIAANDKNKKVRSAAKNIIDKKLKDYGKSDNKK